MDMQGRGFKFYLIMQMSNTYIINTFSDNSIWHILRDAKNCKKFAKSFFG